MRPSFTVSGLVLALLAAPLFAVGEATTVQAIPQPSSAVVGAGGPWTRDMGLLPSYSSDAIAAEISPWINAALAATNTSKSGTPWTVRKSLSLSEVGEEGYRLTTSAEGWTLDAATDAGLYYGVQTARQLLNSGSVAPLEIEDVPALSWRGVMYDHARNFLGVEFTKRLIDQMGALKLNRLHLHLTDDQGWRIALPSYPALTTTGASSSTGGQSTWGAFTREEWLELDAYAQKRHVVLVPEIDLPGHTHAVKSTYPSLGLGCGANNGWPYTGEEVGFSYICNNDAGKNFIKTALEELSEMTSGPYVHIGGDECQAMNLADPSAYPTLVRHAESTVNAKGKIAVGWAGIANGAQSSTSILQKWEKGGGAPGANWINSTCSSAYIDHPEESPSDAYSWASWCEQEVSSWSVYNIAAGSVGVEATLWSEKNTNATNAENKLFPRIVALAENGWTPAAKRNWSRYASNLSAFGESFFRNVPAPADPDPGVGIERAPVHTLASARPVEHMVFTVSGRRVASFAAEEGVGVADQMRNGVFAPGSYLVGTRWSDGSVSRKRIVLR